MVGLSGQPELLITADMRELLELFHEHEVEYVLVGGHAVTFYGYVRATQDLDILVPPSPANAARIVRALTAFGFGGAGIPPECFERSGTAIHLGAEPNRIDLLTSLKGVSAEEILAGSDRVELAGLPVTMISFEHLVAVKRASDRPRDLADVDELLKTRARVRRRRE